MRGAASARLAKRFTPDIADSGGIISSAKNHQGFQQKKTQIRAQRTTGVGATSPVGKALQYLLQDGKTFNESESKQLLTARIDS